MNFFYGCFLFPSVSSLLCYKQHLRQASSDDVPVFKNCDVCQTLEYSYGNGSYVAQNCITGKSGCLCPTYSIGTNTRCQCCSADLCNTAIFTSDNVEIDSNNTLQCYDQELEINSLTGVKQNTIELTNKSGCSMCMIINETNYKSGLTKITQSCYTNQIACSYDWFAHSNDDSIYTTTCCYANLCNSLATTNATFNSTTTNTTYNSTIISSCSFTDRFWFWNIFGTLFLIVAYL
ncbi:uncharacterized protein LOC105845032 [Hydra vulgaris]|uniref:uncharacterized protein LOC105845032 n=1 Tax=Hydra vulgaris TaxID=6087 RepID=UPI000640D04B|nr:uncharacterized protein LOC105845032 [Hydra vulgaris]